MAIYLLQPDGVALSAGAHRRGRAALNGGGSGRAVGGRSGFRVDTPSDVLVVSTSGWSLKACAAMIDPGASTNQGMYGWASDSTITGTPTPPDATLPRKDIYYIQVNDPSAGDGTSGTASANVYYAAGTPSASPVAPALPPRSLLIGTATVPQVGGGSPTVVLNPARFVAAGARLPIASAGERALLSGYEGFEILRTDLKQASPAGVIERHNGTGWDHFGHSEWTFNQTNAGFTSGILFGTGALTNDATRTTDTGFVTTSGETLVVRDAGIYSCTLTGSWSKPSTSRAFSEIHDSSSGQTFRASAAVDENMCTVTFAGVRLGAGAVLTPKTFTVFASGSNTWAGRIRVNRDA